MNEKTMLLEKKLSSVGFAKSKNDRGEHRNNWWVRKRLEFGGRGETKKRPNGSVSEVARRLSSRIGRGVGDQRSDAIRGVGSIKE
jgi:hypothetical protein